MEPEQLLVNYLNELLVFDRKGITSLFDTAVPCNEDLANISLAPVLKCTFDVYGNYFVRAAGIMTGAILYITNKKKVLTTRRNEEGLIHEFVLVDATNIVGS